MEFCNVISSGYPEKINYFLDIIFARHFQYERLSLNLKRTSNEEVLDEPKRLKLI